MISEVTKRNIFDEMELKKVVWHGRLEEDEFLDRIFDLEQLPSYDPRFENMRGDLWQHRVNNYDWDDWWVINDDRLNLFEDDNKFLQLLCQILHPVVRNDTEEVKSLLNLFNAHLAADGWKIVEKSRISGRPVFTAIQYKSDFKLRNENGISQKFAGDQLAKCEGKIARQDYDGAISSARSFLEGAIADIYQRITGEKLEITGNLPDKYKMIKNLLRLAAEQSSDKNIKSVCKGFSTIIYAIDQISNTMGDRHVPVGKAEEYHASFCVNSAKVVADFLYDRLNHLYQGQENLYEGLISALNEDKKRALTREELLNDPVIEKIIEKCDPYVFSLLKNKFINDYVIGSFRENDIFFATMRIFFDYLGKADIKRIFEKCKDNDQTLPPYGGLIRFLKEVQDQKPKWLEKEHIKFIKQVQNDKYS